MKSASGGTQECLGGSKAAMGTANEKLAVNKEEIECPSLQKKSGKGCAGGRKIRGG